MVYLAVEKTQLQCAGRSIFQHTQKMEVIEMLHKFGSFIPLAVSQYLHEMQLMNGTC